MKNKIIAVCVCLVVLLGCIGILQWRSVDADERMIADIETPLTEEVVVAEEKVETIETTSHAPSEDAGSFTIGNPDAPITILEFSSLSCPHCASFHAGALPDIKKDYVDTGKVKFVFRDFPLNGSAVSASLLLKCVPLNERYDFMEMLFNQQSDWAFDGNYQTKLKQYAALIGIGTDKAESCMNDSATEKAMFDTMREGNSTHEITSTPTFVIQPGDEKLTGSQSYGAFSSRIETLLKEGK